MISAILRGKGVILKGKGVVKRPKRKVVKLTAESTVQRYRHRLTPAEQAMHDRRYRRRFGRRKVGRWELVYMDEVEIGG